MENRKHIQVLMCWLIALYRRSAAVESLTLNITCPKPLCIFPSSSSFVLMTTAFMSTSFLPVKSKGKS